MTNSPSAPKADERSDTGRSHEMVLAIGSEACRLILRGAPGTFLQQLHERYDPWRLPASTNVRERFCLRVKLVSAVPSSRARRNVGSTPLTVYEDEGAVGARRWDFHARLAQRPEQPTRFQGTAVCELNVLTFDSLLRVLWSMILPRVGGLLVHACAVRVDQAAVLLPGPSGAGKSTFAAKMPDADDVLTDELAAVLPEKDSWRVFSTPFWGDFRRGGGSLRSWPLRAVCMLEQRPAPALLPLGSAESLARLLSCMLYFGHSTAAVERNVAVAAALMSKVPCYSAHLAKDTAPSVLFALLSDAHVALAQPDDRRPARELISEFRWMLNKHGKYAYQPRGYSMKPWIPDGAAVVVARTDVVAFEPGQVLVYWTPGPTAADDTLTCHRLVVATADDRQRIYTKGDNTSGITRFDNGRQAEVLGVAVRLDESDTGKPSVGRARDRLRLLLSLSSQPLMRWLGR